MTRCPTSRLPLALVALLALTSPAAAEQFEVSGAHGQRGPFMGWLKLDRKGNGDLMVVLGVVRDGREVVSAGPVLDDAERRGRWFDSRLADLHGH